MMLFQAQRQSCKVGFKGNAETKMIRDRETCGKRETKRQKETETKKESHPQHSKKRRKSTATTNNDQHDTSAKWVGMRGRDAAKELTLKVNILQVFTIDCSEIQHIVNHNSQSDGQNKSAKSGMNLHKKTIHIISLQRKRKDTKDNGILP